MDYKKLFYAVILLVVLGFGYEFWAGRPTQPTATTTQEQDLLGGSATSTGNKEYAESGSTYTVSVLYPAKTALTNSTADQKAREYIQTALKAEVDDFKQNIAGLDATVLPSLSDGHKLELDATYKSYSSAQTGTVSYAYTIFADTGGAHPNIYFKTFTFDQNGKAVSIYDIIKSNDLAKLSTIVTADVTAQLKQRLEISDVSEALFSEGLKPTEDNYSTFVVDGDTLVVLIPPYQVAAYAVGSFEVRVPLSAVE